MTTHFFSYVFCLCVSVHHFRAWVALWMQGITEPGSSGRVLGYHNHRDIYLSGPSTQEAEADGSLEFKGSIVP